jgi:HK97 family phage major capsid protein
MTTEAAFTIDAVLIGGTGAGQPQGILSCPNLLTTLKQVGALAGSFAWEDALAMYQNANPAGDEGLIWLFSPSLKTQVLSMSMGIGTAGVGFFPALREASGNLTLLAKSVFWTEHCRRAGQVGDALLVNPRSLAVGIRQQVQIDTSEHVYFTTDHVAFRLTMRIDAQSKYSDGLTLSDGVTRVSDLVTLEGRS